MAGEPVLQPVVFRRVVVRSVLAPALALGLAAVLLLLQVRALVRLNAELHAIDETISLAYFVTRVEVDQQTALRGFVITRNARLLQPESKAQTLFDATIRSLSGRLGERERATVLRLVRSDAEWDRYAEAVLRAPPDQASALVATGRGEDIINAIRVDIRDLVGRLEAERNRRSLRASETARRVTVAIVVGVIAACGLLAAFVPAQLRRVATAYDAAIREVHETNAGLEERIRQRTALLEEANRELESFAYSVSHDLRAPIRHMAGFAQLLATKTGSQFDEKGRRYLTTIVDAAGDAGRLVDELLAFSRMGRADLRREPVDLNATFAAARQQLAAETDRRIDWEVGHLPVVRGDPTMLRLVVYNLLSNAVKYTRLRQDARVRVVSSRSDGEYVVSVEDNGVGFDMQYAGKLFGVFQRLHDASQFEGTGIGLANVRRIIARHGGRVWAEGVPGEGARFSFSLPAD